MIGWWWIHAALAQATLQVPAQFPTLQLAVLAAQPGDTIEVDAAGGYLRAVDQDVLIGSSVTVLGVNGQPLLPRLVVTGGAVTLSNVRIRGVSRQFVDLAGRDAGAVVLGGSLTVLDAEIESTLAGSLGIAGLGGDVWLERVHASDFWSYPAVELAGGRLDVVDGTFEYLSAGAIVVYEAEVAITRGTFAWNWAEAGADIKVSNAVQGSLVVHDSTFTSSTATWGGAVFAEGADVTLSGSAFTDPIAWTAGGALYVAGRPMAASALLVENTTFDRAYAPSGGAILAGSISGGVIDGGTFMHGVADSGGAIALTGGDLTVRDSTFDSNQAQWGNGGAIVVSSEGYDGAPAARLTLVDTELAGVAGAPAAWSGGCLAAGFGATVTIEGGSLHDCSASLGGGAVYFEGDALSLTGTTVAVNQAGWGGAIHQVGGALSLAGVKLEGNQAGTGAAIQGHQVSVDVADSAFTGNTSEWSVVDLSEVAALDLRRNRWCGNAAGTGSGVLVVTGAGAGPFTVSNEVFLGNLAEVGTNLYYGPSDWLINQGPELWLRNNDFVGNHVAAAVSVRGRVDFRNNLVVDQPIGLVLEQAANNELAGDHNLWRQTDPSQGNDGRFPAANDLVDIDPLFQGWVEGDCASNLWLQHGSPARDAGDPSLFDPDGSRSDIGAFGGPDAGLNDADGDGWSEDLDCDEADAAVFPGALDVPYDGVDGDCDGEDRCDLDGDGVKAEACGGRDCDDDDRRTHPGAADPPDDGVDQDCDDFQPRTWMMGGSGCDHAGGGAPWLAWIAAAWAARGRRVTARR